MPLCYFVSQKMKTKSISLIITLLLICHCVYADETTSHTKWEYKTWNAYPPPNSKDTTTAFEESLNRLGQDGWELVSVVAFADRSNLTVHYFKRPLRKVPRRRVVPRVKHVPKKEG